MSGPEFAFPFQEFLIQAESVPRDPGATTDWTPGIILVVVIFCVVIYWSHHRRRRKAGTIEERDRVS